MRRLVVRSLIFIFLLAGSIETRFDSVKPNILLISLDTVRADHLSSYGHPRPTTPNLDRLTKHGVLFTRGFSQAPWTLPSHMSVFTGMYPSSHGVDRDGVQLPKTIPTIGELLRPLGYISAGFVSAGYVSSAFGFQRGFDTFLKIPSPLDRGTEKITQNGLDFLQDWSDRKEGKPFFLFLHYLDAHTPYNPPEPLNTIYDPEYDGEMTGFAKDFSRYFNPRVQFENPADLEHIKSLYDGQIRRIDAALGSVFRKLVEIEQLNDTMIIIFSDHGEEFKDHKSMDHGKTLYREQIYTPIIIVYPKLVHPRSMIDTPVQNIDLLPTCLAILGEKIPAEIQGKSLLPLLKPGIFDRLFYRHHVAEYAQTQRINYRVSSVIMDNYKFVLRDKPSEIKELYDISKDPAEHDNLLQEDPDRAQKMFKVLGDWLAKTYIAKGKTQPTVMDEETIDHLRKIGYNFAGMEKNAASSLNGPQGIAVDPRGRLYVADSFNDQIKILNSNFEIIASIGSGINADFWEKTEFHIPVDVCFDRSGNFYASESGNQRIHCLNSDREFRYLIESTSAVKLRDTAGITVDSANQIYLCDPITQRVVRFDQDGKSLGYVGQDARKPATFNKPTCIALDDDGNIYVGDVGVAKIFRLTPDGELVSEWPVPAWKVYANRNLNLPFPHMTIDTAAKWLYLSDPSGCNVFRCSLEGKQLLACKKKGKMQVPCGVALLPDGTIAVSDYQANTINKLAPIDFD